jgi:large subunit ribosomal protein L22
MAEITAKLNYLRISPRKVRTLTKPLKGLSVFQADAYLRAFHRGASEPLRKLIASAVANAQHNHHFEKDGLYIFRITVDAGPTLKRMLPRAYGSPSPILKRTSHVSLVLRSKKGAGRKIKTRQMEQKQRVTEEISKPTPVIVAEKKEKVAYEIEQREPSRRRRLPRRQPPKQFRAQAPNVLRRVFRRKAI